VICHYSEQDYFDRSQLPQKIQSCESSAVLLPILFAIYVNDIISGRGCHVAGIYVGVLM